MSTKLGCPALGAILLIFSIPNSANSLTIREFRKHPNQAVYVSAAISMLVYTYAADGDAAKARCIQDWYFRDKDAKEPAGPRELAVEIKAAELKDPYRYHVEGVILGLVDRNCAPPARSEP